jgi:hypothetical protein
MGAEHLTSAGAMLMATGMVQTAPISPDPRKTVLVGISTLTGPPPAPVPALTGGGVRWTQLSSATEIRDGVAAPRRLTLFAGSGVEAGPLTISVPPQDRQNVSWSVVEATGDVVQIGSTPVPLAGPPAELSLPSSPTGTVVAFFLIGTASAIRAVAPAEKLGQGDTPTFPSSTSTEVSTEGTVKLRWTPDGPGHYLGIIVEMSA